MLLLRLLLAQLIANGERKHYDALHKGYCRLSQIANSSGRTINNAFRAQSYMKTNKLTANKEQKSAGLVTYRNARSKWLLKLSRHTVSDAIEMKLPSGQMVRYQFFGMFAVQTLHCRKLAWYLNGNTNHQSNLKPSEV